MIFPQLNEPNNNLQ